MEFIVMLENQGLKVSEIAVGSWMTDLAGDDKVNIARDTIRLCI